MSWNRGGHKYGAKKTVVDGITFDSKAEAKRYGELKLLEKAGAISELELQPRFLLQGAFKAHNGKTIRKIEYVADFKYIESHQVVVEDVKGQATPDFKLKWKMFQYSYPYIDARMIGGRWSPKRKRGK